jgi:DNA replication protein DnaC
MTEEIAQLLENLKLRTTAARFDEVIACAEENGTPIVTVLTQLLRAEWEARMAQTIDRRIRRARFPEEWTLESFPFKKQPGVKERLIRALAQLDFIGNAENIVMIGETGTGKTGLLTAIGRKAAQNGYRVLFIKAQELFDEMYASLADRSTRRLLRSLSRVDVLVIDELGYLNVKTEQANVFFKLMEERHRRRPTLISTNLPYAAWQDLLGNAALTKALLSRLRERCHTILIDGPCIRPQTG